MCIYFSLAHTTNNININNPFDNMVVNNETFRKYAIVGINIINISDFLYLADIELMSIRITVKKTPIIIIPTKPQAATPSVRKKLALAFWLP